MGARVLTAFDLGWAPAAPTGLEGWLVAFPGLRFACPGLFSLSLRDENQLFECFGPLEQSTASSLCRIAASTR
jgi:hypothetical protein